MRKFFAVVEILAAVGIAVAAIMYYRAIQNSIFVIPAESLAQATDSYRVVIGHGRNVFEKAYRTIPQHKKTLALACLKIDGVRKGCENTEAFLKKVPNKWQWQWLESMKMLPGQFYEPFGEMKKSLECSIDVLNSYNDEQYKDTLQAFDQATVALSEISTSLHSVSAQWEGISFWFLILSLCFSAAFCANGVIILLSSGREKCQEN